MWPRTLFVLIVTLTIVSLRAEDGPAAPPNRAENSEGAEGARRALQPLQVLVGAWRGVGQVRRGSSQGAWREEGEWVWNFADDTASLKFQADDDAKHLRTLVVAPAETKGQSPQTYRLVARGPEKEVAEYEAQMDESERLIATREQGDDTLPDRITIRTVAGGDRLLVLLERKSPVSNRFLRLAEVGYTRKGSDFGQGTNFVECIVTGGKGTIPVTHDGKTYYVCCTGCRDYFNEDPENTLAEYKAAQAEKKSDE